MAINMQLSLDYFSNWPEAREIPTKEAVNPTLDCHLPPGAYNNPTLDSTAGDILRDIRRGRIFCGARIG